MELLLSGLLGALVASILSVFYQHVSIQANRRFDVMIKTADYFDELYDNLQTLEAYKRKAYTHGMEVVTEEYQSLARRTGTLLKSSGTHAHVALVYGQNSRELQDFNTLRARMQEVGVGRGLAPHHILVDLRIVKDDAPECGHDAVERRAIRAAEKAGD